MILWELFAGFLKVGCFAFGGAYGAIPLIRDVVLSRGWLDDEMLTYMIAVSESTPGPIAINCATYVGYRQAGFAGALAATVGMVLPSFAIIFAISRCLDHFLAIAWIAHAFQGIKIAVGLLILDAALKMLQKMQKKPLPRAFMLCAFAAMLLIDLLSLRVSSIVLMLAAGLVSLVFFPAGKPAAKGGEGK